MKSITALLLSFLLLFQADVASATTGTVSGNQPVGEEAIAAVSENQPCESGEPEAAEESDSEEEEAAMEDAVLGQSLPEIQAGTESPANPVHHCTKENDGSDYTDFSYVYFGSYPQSEVMDSVTITAIDRAIEKYGTVADAGMDVWVNGTKYRRIGKDDTNDDGYNFDKMTTSNGYRYFKWERMKWKVLENDGNTLFVVADRAIESKDYNEEWKTITWETSTIRDWLNAGFYNAAFSNNEQSAIITQNVVNEDNPEYDTEGGNDTSDKIYLLSISEVENETYGFCSDYSIYSMSRRMKVSDYANARGTWRHDSSDYKDWDNCWWWLRSPGRGSSYAVYVTRNGDVPRVGNAVYLEYVGVCPALHIDLSSDIWFIKDDQTSGNGGDEKAANPVASIPAGSSIAKNTKLTLSCATVGADIYYTTDGTIPTMESTLYTGEITIDRDMTVKAVAMCKGYRISDVAEFSYKVQEGSSEETKENSNIKVQKLTIKAPSKKLAAGKKVQLTLNVTPANATNKAVQWRSSNQKYATVKDGRITLKKQGIGKTVTITAAAADGSGKKATIKIKIMRHAVKSIKLAAPNKTLKAGKSMTIKAAVKTTGKNANKTLKWTSSNTKYATVNSKGKVTAKKAGKGKTVTITATSTDGSNKKAKMKIKIK